MLFKYKRSPFQKQQNSNFYENDPLKIFRETEQGNRWVNMNGTFQKVSTLMKDTNRLVL